MLEESLPSLAPPALRRLERSDPRWDTFVRAHPEGTFYHLQGWKRVIERAYGRPAHYLFTERDGRITGVLPSLEAGAKPFTSALVSIPVGVGGGILASDDESALLLRSAARAIAERESLAYIEYKSEKRRFADLATKGDLYFTFKHPIYGDREKQLADIPRKTRAMLRDAERAQLRWSYNRDDLEPFYDLYALSLRNLGTPMFPKELFVACVEEFPDECNFLTVRENGRIIGTLMNFYYQQTMLPYFVGTLPDARDVGVNHYLYWVMLETGYDLGYRWFDFGRSKKDTGPFRFKQLFGMKEYPLEYQYDLVGIAELPNVNPTNPKYARAIETWKKLPVELTKLVGPLLARRIP